MPVDIKAELFISQIHYLIQETFEKVEGIYLDGGTSLAETLRGVSAVEASTPTIPGGSTIAGHSAHVRFYLRVLHEYMGGTVQKGIDWKQSWLTSKATDSEWEALRQGLAEDYRGLQEQIQSFDDWNDERRLGGAMATVVHTAFHLGAIRQMILAIRKAK